MNRIVVIICILLSIAAGANGQNHHRHDSDRHRTEKVHSRSRQGSHRGSHHTDHRGGVHNVRGRHSIPAEVECLHDWQELWNGCHVRLTLGRVSVVDRDGDTIVRGDRIFLTSNGNYEVKSGDIWRVYEHDGDFTTMSGWDIFYWPEGFYGVKVGEFWRLYHENGDMVGNIWGEHLSLLRNNLIKATRNGRTFYYDFQGNERR